MQYLLLLGLVILFLVSYYFSGRDFFAPMTLQVMTFIFAAMMLIYLMANMNYRLHGFTVWMILSCLAVSVFIGIAIHGIFAKIRIQPVSADTQKATPIPTVVLMGCILFILATIAWQFSEVRRVGGMRDTFVNMMAAYRSASSYTADMDTKQPFLLKQMIGMVNVLFIICGFNLLKFYKKVPQSQRFQCLIIFSLCIVNGFLGGARGGIVYDIIACAVIYHLLRIQRLGRYKTYSIRFLMKLMSITILILFLFSALRGFAGRTNSKNAMDYIAQYTGAPILDLDLYFQKPPQGSNIFGKYTFYSIISALIRAGVLKIDPYIVHLEFRSVEGVSLGNVYTFIRTYHYDFGIWGVYIFTIANAIIFSTIYEYVKKKRGDMMIIFFGSIYYAITITFFAERLFSTVISLGTFRNIVSIYILYELMFRKRIRLKRIR